MSWVRIWVHLVFSTKNRTPFFDANLRKIVFQHMKQHAQEKGIWLDCVNGYIEHAHCLISLGKEQSVSKIAQELKGESSHWINQNQLCAEHFNWQDDYWAVSVSESHLPAIRNYIYQQEEQHSRISFEKEVEGFMKKFGWVFVKEK